MKKFLFISLFCTFALFSSAQINRTIFGIQLGDDINTVKKILVNKGFTIACENTEIGYTISIKNPIFSGIQWDYAYLITNNGKVYSFVFAKEDYDFDNKHRIENECINIGTALYSKYFNYAKDTDTDNLVFDDTNTRIILSYVIDGYEEQGFLTYLDLEGKRNYEKSVLNEL